MNVLIIGGVAAGTKVAAKLKRENLGFTVTVLTKSQYISYAGCGLPYYVGGMIENQEQLIVNTPESFSALTGATVKTGVEITSIDRSAKTVTGVCLKTGQDETYAYDKLVLAVGASPIRPPIDGIDLPGVFFMRTPEDAVLLRSALERDEIKRAVVVGGGFIGLEVAENLLSRGVRVSVLDMAEHVLPGFDPEICEYVENYLADRGLMTFPGTKLEAILGEGRVEKVQTSRRVMKADAAILSIGIRANTGFLTGSGLALAPNRTVMVNQYLETNDPDIYAVGDCACVTHRITRQPFWSPMGSSANLEGRLAAINLSGGREAYAGPLGTGVVRLPELNAGRTGLTELAAKEAGFDVETVVVVTDDKAHYYPGASFFIIKLIADRKTGRLLGLQALGKGAVDKLVDIAVTAIGLGGKLSELRDLDFAYAPPFSTAIHPFAHAINILLNKMSGQLTSMTPTDYLACGGEGYQLIDASITPSIPGAPYVDLTKVTAPLPEYPLNAPLLLVCAKGKRAYLLQNRLNYYGYTNTKVLEGGTTVNQIKNN